jgi:hypothetical protein
MPLEIKGTRLRYRVKRPVKGAVFRTDDVGMKGHTQRIAMKNLKTGKWSTQSWTFPVSDIKERRPATMKVLSKLGIKRKALKKVI